jgi:hypothetical protein
MSIISDNSCSEKYIMNIELYVKLGISDHNLLIENGRHVKIPRMTSYAACLVKSWMMSHIFFFIALKITY